MVNRYLLIVLLAICNMLALSAQEDQKYLAGAVPEVDGKVKFVREIKVDSKVATTQLYKYAREWANSFYKPSEEFVERVLLENPGESYIACQGDRYLIFSSNFLSLDRTRISYQLIIKAESAKYVLEIRNIKYEYADYKEVMSAEEMITDRIALNKDKTKLNRHYDKFRRATVDHVEEIEKSFLNYLADRESVSRTTSRQEDVKVESASAVQKSVPLALVESSSVSSDMSGYKQINAGDLSEGIMSMFKDSWALVTTGSADEIKPMTAAWSGVGNFGAKPVSMVLVDTKGVKGEIYTISFYTTIHKGELDKVEKGQKASLTPIFTPSGAVAYSEAWMIIECKKVMEQDADASMIEAAQSKAWSKNDFDKLFMGEIINVWAR